MNKYFKVLGKHRYSCRCYIRHLNSSGALEYVFMMDTEYESLSVVFTNFSTGIAVNNKSAKQ